MPQLRPQARELRGRLLLGLDDWGHSSERLFWREMVAGLPDKGGNVAYHHAWFSRAAAAVVVLAIALVGFALLGSYDASTAQAQGGVGGDVGVLPAFTCSDGEDNDGDGKTDYPDDPGCTDIIDTDETDSAPPPDSCSKYASPTGSDTNSGNADAPYKTAQQLANSLSAGQTGCLKGGVYTESDNTVNISAGGTPSAGNTLMSAPGEASPARINARVTVADTADYLTLKDLVFDGSYSPSCSSGASCKILPSPTINGDHVHLINNDISSRNPSSPSRKAGICINAGTSGNTITGLLIEGNKIHHCGRIPSSNLDHGIYLGHTRDTIIKDNLIYQNADRAIQMYPDGDSTLIEGNVIAYNGDGVHFSGSGTEFADSSLVRHNVITDAKLGYNVDAYEGQLDSGVTFPGPSSPYRNEVVNNCVYGGYSSPSTGGVEQNAEGSADYFYTSGNVVANPLYANPSSFDYTVGSSSGCRAPSP